MTSSRHNLITLPFQVHYAGNVLLGYMQTQTVGITDSIGYVVVVDEILFAAGSAGRLVYQLAVLEAVPLPVRYTKELWEEKFFVLVAQSKGRGSAE